jgi:hypothetical protein
MKAASSSLVLRLRLNLSSIKTNIEVIQIIIIDPL